MRIVELSTLKILSEMLIDAYGEQIILLESIGFTSQRGAQIDGIKERATYLLKIVEQTEDASIEAIQDYSLKIINNTAEERDLIIEVSREINHSRLALLATLASRRHDETVHSLGFDETHAVKDVSKKLSEVKNNIHKLLAVLDNLRVR